MQEVPSVGHLDRLRRSLPERFGIGAGAIPADNLHARVCVQPRGDGLALPVGQKIDHPARLKVA